MKTGALVAAAGLSSRMGAFKPMLPLSRDTILRHGVKTLLQAGCGPVAVVVGRHGALLKENLSDLPVTCVYNPAYASCEMLDSVKLGLAWLEGRCDRLLFTPGDVCMYDIQTILALERSRARLCHPTFKGRRGHPVLISCGLIPEILAYDGDRGLAGALAGVEDQEEIAVDNPGILMDVDTYDEYRFLRAYERELLCRI